MHARYFCVFWVSSSIGCCMRVVYAECMNTMKTQQDVKKKKKKKTRETAKLKLGNVCFIWWASRGAELLMGRRDSSLPAPGYAKWLVVNLELRKANFTTGKLLSVYLISTSTNQGPMNFDIIIHSIKGLSLGTLNYKGMNFQNPKCNALSLGFIVKLALKGIVSDSNNIFSWYESEDINKKGVFPKFQLIPILVFKLCMIMCVSLLP